MYVQDACFEAKQANACKRKDGRVVECAGLEIRFTGSPVTRVQIPLFPPVCMMQQARMHTNKIHLAVDFLLERIGFRPKL